ncbi:MAG TPA: hypothetical protein VG898_11200 [Solirubrobacterales bacterium]|nr:hypothetical protein [Solirubrobacterales bacterium]
MRRLFVAALVASMMLVPASQAIASPHHPTGEFAPFGDCPLSHATVAACVFSESNGGYFQMGAKKVPLVNPVILQGGLEFNAKGESTFVGAEDGNTLSKTPQPVPGGLLGVEAPSWWPSWLKNWFNETINQGLTGVTATVELAAPASAIKVNTLNLIIENGTALSLPVKIKLSNPFLGSSCYIGSNSKPVTIDFTTGATSPPPPNKSIHGSKGELFVNETGTLVKLSGGQLVNNSFAAPGASGCGGLLSFLIDPFVNSIVGLPSAAGTNTAILEGVLETGDAAAVKASE